MLTFKADKDSETDNGLKVYYNTESSACTNQSYYCEDNAYLRF